MIFIKLRVLLEILNSLVSAYNIFTILFKFNTIVVIRNYICTFARPLNLAFAMP